MQLADDRRPSIIPLDFRVDYLPQPDGSMKEIEIVEYTRKGSQGATTPARIEHLQRGGGQDPVWLVIKPYYENWKQGRSAPIDGTALAAWPGGTPQLVKALEAFHIRSIEDLANLTDGTMDRVPVPGIRGYRTQAKAYVEAQRTTSVVAADLAAKDTKIAEQDREIAELKELVQAIAAKQGITLTDDKPAKRGRKAA